MKKVYVGLSGGVDSSVAAALLKRQGFEVVGVFMKNWSRDLPGMPCPWKDDYQDAKRVAVQLGIDFKMYDFEAQYQQKVVDYMLDGFKAGITPNPDVMCNQEIKFKLFLDTALEDGADMIATGHYAKVENTEYRIQNSEEKIPNSQFPIPNSSEARLFMAADDNKDQTYFLCRVSKDALEKTLFPLGGYTKPQVRELAKKFKLVTADKKDSMGICFVGKVGIKDFLKQYIDEQPGAIVDQAGNKIGTHDGAIFYTIGQRHGLELGGGLPYYVTGKNMDKNEVHVTTDLQDEKLWSRQIRLTSMHWISSKPENPESRIQNTEFRIQNSESLQVRTRHRAKLIPVKLLNPSTALRAGKPSDTWIAELEEDVRAITPGQSAVFYRGSECLGGAIVTA